MFSQFDVSDVSAAINLRAIKENYARLKQFAGDTNVAAVVKCDAYGFGLEQVSRALDTCDDFFVVTVREGVLLRESRRNARIYVLGEPEWGAVNNHNLIPVINTMSSLKMALEFSIGSIAIHIDTGMSRTGIPYENYHDALTLCKGTKIDYVLSHLACSDRAIHPTNEMQLGRFKQIQRDFPQFKYSLGNSNSLALPRDYWFDQVRCGGALYGISNNVMPMHIETVVTVTAPVVQKVLYRELTHVGYGSTRSVPAGSTIATIPVGYGHGYPFALSNNGYCGFAGSLLPVVGKVSMDYIMVDASEVADQIVEGASLVELIGPNVSVEKLAALAAIPASSIFTSLVARSMRSYTS